ncbi:MAG: RsmB/NOP family class I SAM-dependent RNA methyltransferase [Clostridia bacterium]|nr:RsmB/NOP family class I SAM-dependent RNA methyltransferase [Clostridia bacterium]
MTSLPAPFIESTRALLGDEAAPFFRALEAPFAAALRLNPRRDGAEAASLPFTEDAVPWCPAGRYIRPGARPGLSPLHAAGAYYIQEASAMAPAAALDVRPGELALDLCAAPGGKSGQIAAALEGRGALVANEPDPARARLLAATLERLGVPNALVTNAWPQELAARFPETFDAILVDAPCSGEGMFRREPESRLEWREGSPAGCAARQAGILDQAAAMLRPGGRLVYSTCTFNRAENEDTVSAFLDRHPDFAPEDFALPGVGASESGCLRLWPHRVRGDGQFAARLRKAGSSAPAHRPRLPRVDRETQARLAALHEIAPGWAAGLEEARFLLRGDTLCALPGALPDFSGLRALRCGLHLCRLGRGYIEPDHALAMALKAKEAAQAAEFDEAQALRLLSGETAESALRGWTLLTHRGMPLGWGKASGGVMKNHIPKGLRIHINT